MKRTQFSTKGRETRLHALARHVPFEFITIEDNFWYPRQELMVSKSLHLQHGWLEEFHHVDNFRIASGEKTSQWRGLFYFDSDLYKWLEAATFALVLRKNSTLRALVEEVVTLIMNAQQDDGYVNTFFTCNFPDQRLKNFYVMHELYCAGHLLEAAVARAIHDGKNDLLGVARRFCDLLINMQDTFRKGIFVPGHEELELALFKAYNYTKDVRFKDFAISLLENRGKNRFLGATIVKSGTHALKLVKRQGKMLKRHDRSQGRVETHAGFKEIMPVKPKYIHFLRMFSNTFSGKYSQQHTPIREQTIPVGHSVRATYLYSSVVDYFMETGDRSLLDAMLLAWDRMTGSRMYITGGIGSLPVIEGWGRDHELDNEVAYCETCAAIGNMLWNWRLWMATADGKFMDLLERILYNAFLAGWSIDGTTYSYNNPLAVDDKDLKKPWFSTACCPPNIGRIVTSLGNYIYGVGRDNGLIVNQYIGNDFTLRQQGRDPLHVKLESGFPWSFNVRFHLVSASSISRPLRFRIPAWADDTRVVIDGKEDAGLDVANHYLHVPAQGKEEQLIEMSFSAPPRFINPDPRVKCNRDRVAIQHGPIVYCVESCDNDGIDISGLQVDCSDELICDHEEHLLGGINVIKGSNFTAIPYFAWNNRGTSSMRVWLDTQR
ncbi:MAG: glycoside hydrolase family 127 protein [Promethearchaeota archaeon]